MVIPAPNNTQAFKAAKVLFDQVKELHVHPEDWDTLSMGMSGDMVDAIAAGRLWFALELPCSSERLFTALSLNRAS